MLDRVRFVLVGTQHGGNVGSAARALKNLGFRRLELVRPECDPTGEDARKMAVDARDVLEQARIHDDLDRALGEATTVVATTRRLGKHRQPHHALHAVADRLIARARAGGELAFLFGREDSGLTDQELDRATDLVYLPSSTAYPSFNLSQAVLLVGYQLLLTSGAPEHEPPDVRPAGHEEREAMYRHLERAFVAIGFLSRDTQDVIMRRFRRALGRAEMSREEVKMLRGVARQTLWAARQAGLLVPPEPDEDAPAEDR